MSYHGDLVPVAQLEVWDALRLLGGCPRGIGLESGRLRVHLDGEQGRVQSWFGEGSKRNHRQQSAALLSTDLISHGSYKLLQATQYPVFLSSLFPARACTVRVTAVLGAVAHPATVWGQGTQA